MTKEEACSVMETERACVVRQDTPFCSRQCDKCDLCLPSGKIIEAYDTVIKMLREDSK